MSRRTLAHAVWKLSADDRPGVPVAVFRMECATCHEMSTAADGDGRPAQTWSLAHTGMNPGHRGFTLHTETCWRVEPGAGNPYGEVRP
ncbi:hypothetical protein [Streptomyces sp. NPDC094049]|uniref:DUF7848 domain-containing protein n=1 Tax=Streptomyces sp. NPDC094049 TaxID=3154987 RepID=UPI00331926C0